MSFEDFNDPIRHEEVPEVTVWTREWIHATWPDGYDVSQLDNKINYWGEHDYEPETNGTWYEAPANEPEDRLPGSLGEDTGEAVESSEEEMYIPG